MKLLRLTVPLLLAAAGTLAQQPVPKPPQAPAPQAAPKPAGPPVAVLQGLDKVTARVSKLTVPVGEATTFGSLTVHVDACIKRPPEEPPESAAFLRITDRPPPPSGSAKPVPTSQDPFETLPERIVFSGWMFASSPALHPLEHPVFDIIVLDCRPN